MKKITLLLTCLCVPVIFVFSQTSWSLTGNSGTNPSTNFIGTIDNQPLVFRTNNVEKFRIGSDGTITHTSVGASNGSTVIFSTDYFYGGWVAMNNNSTNTSTGVGYRMNINNTTKSQIFYNGGAFSYGTTIHGISGNTDVLSVAGDVYLSTGTFLSNGLIVKNGTGNVGIGTTTPGTGIKLDVNGQVRFNSNVFIGDNTYTTMGTGYKMSVKDGIITEKLKIRLRANWPDYVFNSNYRLMSLDKLDDFIIKYKHLPGIQSSEQVNKDEGVELGDLNTKLLKKIEELTLYVVRLNKRIDELEKKTNSEKKTKLPISHVK